MELTEFIRARLDEDEAAANSAVADTCAEWHHTPAVTATGPIILIAGGVGDEIEVADAWAGQGAAEHIARHDPARVLREVEAKRKLVQRYLTALAIRKDEVDMGLAWLYGQLCDDAAVWSGHPDYRQEWA